MITTVLCYSATSGADVTDYDTPCRVDMGNVGPVRFQLFHVAPRPPHSRLPQHVSTLVAKPLFRAAYRRCIRYARNGYTRLIQAGLRGHEGRSARIVGNARKAASGSPLPVFIARRLLRRRAISMPSRDVTCIASHRHVLPCKIATPLSAHRPVQGEPPASQRAVWQSAKPRPDGISDSPCTLSPCPSQSPQPAPSPR